MNSEKENGSSLLTITVTTHFYLIGFFAFDRDGTLIISILNLIPWRPGYGLLGTFSCLADSVLTIKDVFLDLAYRIFKTSYNSSDAQGLKTTE